mmetsp:Transcript_10350/g.29076  ORF Transcript_10350/g.29076 Transcript_10350/m.29076 type:complete len:246 (-) Transcript_10350:184-921(-)
MDCGKVGNVTRIVVLGSRGAGASTLVTQFVTGASLEDLESIDFEEEDIFIGGCRKQVNVYDTYELLEIEDLHTSDGEEAEFRSSLQRWEEERKRKREEETEGKSWRERIRKVFHKEEVEKEIPCSTDREKAIRDADSVLLVIDSQRRSSSWNHAKEMYRDVERVREKHDRAMPYLVVALAKVDEAGEGGKGKGKGSTEEPSTAEVTEREFVKMRKGKYVLTSCKIRHNVDAVFHACVPEPGSFVG